MEINKRERRKYKAKDYEYNYRITEDGKRIRLNDTESRKVRGYNVDTTRLSFKNGHLTKAGKAYLAMLMADPEEDRGKALVDEFNLEVQKYANKGETLNIGRFKSHLKNSKIERMIYNFGITPYELAEATGTDVNDILNPDNWKFGKKGTEDWGKATFMGKWGFEFNYEEYNGFKLVKINE